MALDPPSDDFLPDVIRVCAPPSEVGTEGSLKLTPGPPGDPIAASVQPATTSNQATVGATGAAPSGVVRKVVVTAVDPGVSMPRQKILWISSGGVEFSTPVVLVSEGPSERPGSGMARWTVSATIKG